MSFYLSPSMMHQSSMVLNPHRYTCNKHIKHQTRLKLPKKIYNSIAVTKESYNKMSDYNTIHFMGKKPSLN